MWDTSMTRPRASSLQRRGMVLVAKGADVDARDEDGGTALMLAIGNKQEAAAIFLIQRLGDDLDTGHGVSGVSVFEAALEGGLAQVVEVLLLERADVAALDVSAWLRTAVESGDVPVALVLVRHVVNRGEAPPQQQPPPPQQQQQSAQQQEQQEQSAQQQPEEEQQEEEGATGKRLREDVPKLTPASAFARSDDGALLESVIGLPDGLFWAVYTYLGRHQPRRESDWDWSP